MGSQDHKLHILFFPLMSPSHILPVIDTARALAARGLNATILTTHGNMSLLQQLIDRASASGEQNPVQLSFIPFPPVDGLPCETLSLLPKDLHGRFFAALPNLRKPFDDELERLRPDCIVSDVFLPWTADSAAERGVPRLVFQSSNFFVQCLLHSIVKHRPMEGLPHGSDAFVIPGLPHRIQMRTSMMLDVRKVPFFFEMFKKIEKSEAKTFGTLLNTVHELEPEYAEYYRNVMGRRAWSIGPSFLCSLQEKDITNSSDLCLKWLDDQSPRSVVYACFGSLNEIGTAQLHEMALGLEAASHPFVWVVGTKSEEWMPTGFKHRTEGKGLIIKGWAPQRHILNHKAVGVFFSHCGWNSCLEGVSSGLPFVTCPLHADQFYIERFIVDALKIGVAVGMNVHAVKVEDREIVEAAKIERAIKESMGDNEEADRRRKRAEELGELARKAVEKGGSSYNNIDNLIAELTERNATNIIKTKD